MKKKIIKKYTELMQQAEKATGRKETINWLHKASKIRSKFSEIEMM